ncbi:GntR family transcriptional regulator [Caballeronia catudaia]|uniref:GntR family transcriptional regulator n=1 Tax=Caballeronia catudaia TaxID=1777136 RepID=A0A158CJW3_9BURK|nr:GntR family transcriptional regulator [Caballeronia catudaia]
MTPRSSSSEGPMSDLKVDRNAKTLRELTLEKLREAIVQAYFRPGARLWNARSATSSA